MLIDTPDPRYGGGGSYPSRRRVLAGGMTCVVLAQFLPVLGALVLGAAGLGMLVAGVYVVGDDPRDDA